MIRTQKSTACSSGKTWADLLFPGPQQCSTRAKGKTKIATYTGVFCSRVANKTERGTCRHGLLYCSLEFWIIHVHSSHMCRLVTPTYSNIEQLLRSIHQRYVCSSAAPSFQGEEKTYHATHRSHAPAVILYNRISPHLFKLFCKLPVHHCFGMLLLFKRFTTRCTLSCFVSGVIR